MPIPPERIAILHAAYLDGTTIEDAARAARVSPNTAWKKFRAWRYEGLVRGMRAPKQKSGHEHGSRSRTTRWGTPIYRGPDWIG